MFGTPKLMRPSKPKVMGIRPVRIPKIRVTPKQPKAETNFVKSPKVEKISVQHEYHPDLNMLNRSMGIPSKKRTSVSLHFGSKGQ